MNPDDNIDYIDYTLAQLYEARSSVDRVNYPNNAAQIDHYIKIREGLIPEDSKLPERITKKEIDKFAPIDLTLSDIFYTVLGYFKTNKTQIIEKLKYPGLGLLIASYLQILAPEKMSSISFWVVTVLNMYILTVFAVKCHRMVLLDEHTKGIKKALIWSRRETSFLLNEISIGLLSALPVFLLILTSFWIIINFTGGKTWWLLYSAILCLLGGYFFSRMVLILPAVATDQNENFSSWQTSKIYVWKILLFVVMIPSFISFLSTKGEELLPYFIIVSPFINLFSILFAIISLSLIYKKITMAKVN